MTLLEKLIAIFNSLNMPASVAVDEGANRADKYAVLTPTDDSYCAYADDLPTHECISVRISVYSKNDYTGIVKALSEMIINADIIIADKGFIEYECDTGYYHYNIDVKALSAANEGI